MSVSKRETVMPDDPGITTKISPRSVDATVSRLVDLVSSRGMKVFAVIDQRAEAQQAGLDRSLLAVSPSRAGDGGTATGSRCWLMPRS
jgi:hypothetical protein